jgi:hypothetical protein
MKISKKNIKTRYFRNIIINNYFTLKKQKYNIINFQILEEIKNHYEIKEISWYSTEIKIKNIFQLKISRLIFFLNF